MKKLIIAFVVGYSLGCILISLGLWGNTEKLRVIISSVLVRGYETPAASNVLMATVLARRYGAFILMLAIGRFQNKKIWYVAWSGISGWICGYLTMLLIQQYEWWGGVIAVFMYLPHYLLYLPAIWVVIKYQISERNLSKKEYMIFYTAIILILWMGILLETYVSPKIFQLLYQNILV